MFELKNKVALVTGARRGMGKSHAIALASRGAKVVVTDIAKIFGRKRGAIKSRLIKLGLVNK